METKVTNIKGRYHARLYSDDGQLLDEMACTLKQDIGWICREMLRWQDKLGNSNDQTRAARDRQLADPKGKVWFGVQLAKGS